MSDLHLSLLGIGALVIAGVLLYNYLQQRRLHQRLRAAFDAPRRDVLLGEGAHTAMGAADNFSSASRIEPQLEGGRAAPVVMQRTPLPVALNIDETIDCVATVASAGSATPLTAAQVAEVLAGVAACGRSWRAAGYNISSGRWEEINRAVTAQYSRLQVALQLVNRGGPLSARQLGAFSDALNTWAARHAALTDIPDRDPVLAAARALDAFCLEVDVTIGINVIATDVVFSGARVRALVESEGFKLEPDGVFHLEDADENTVLTIANQEAGAFLPEAVSGMSTSGITILLDVPRVADAERALQRMFELGHSLAVTLKGRLVDDNRATLSAASMDKIRQQLKDLHAAMNARGIAPGSARALRLFS